MVGSSIETNDVTSPTPSQVIDLDEKQWNIEFKAGDCPCWKNVRDACCIEKKLKQFQLIMKKRTLQQLAVGRDRGQQRQEDKRLQREHFLLPGCCNGRVRRETGLKRVSN